MTAPSDTAMAVQRQGAGAPPPDEPIRQAGDPPVDRPAASPSALPSPVPARTEIRFDEIETALTEAEDRAALFADPTFVERLALRLAPPDGGRGVLSLDVFDTLLLRDGSSELTRFHEIAARMAAIAGARLGRSVRPVDALLARHLGTRATYRASRPVQGCREGSLIELHRTASRLIAGHADLAEAFVAAELDLEETRLAPNPALVACIDRVRAAGGQVVLVTDMYMHAEHVADLLERHGIGPERYDGLFSSADHRVSKAGGLIFPLVEAALGRGPEAFLHAGDSLQGDFAAPIRRGWAAQHLPLADAERRARRACHAATARALEAEFGLSLDIAAP